MHVCLILQFQHSAGLGDPLHSQYTEYVHPHWDPEHCTFVTTASTLDWFSCGYKTSKYLFYLDWVLVVCSFLQTGPFLLSWQMYEHKAVLYTLQWLSGSVVLSHFIPDISDLCLLFLVLLMVCQFLFFPQRSSFLLHWFSLLFSISLISALQCSFFKLFFRSPPPSSFSNFLR